MFQCHVSKIPKNFIRKLKCVCLSSTWNFVLCAVFYRVFLIFPLFSFKYDPSILGCPGIFLVTCKESKFKGYKKGIKKINYVGNDYSFRVSTFLNWITPHLELLELQTSLETNLGLMINCVLCSKKFYLLIHSKRHTLRPFNQSVGRRFRRKLHKTYRENSIKFTGTGRRKFRQGFCWVTNIICSSLKHYYKIRYFVLWNSI